jgi:hypothetical protein
LAIYLDLILVRVNPLAQGGDLIIHSNPTRLN